MYTFDNIKVLEMMLLRLSKGVYPQSDNGFRRVDIDALKVFVDLWVHLSIAILRFSI